MEGYCRTVASHNIVIIQDMKVANVALIIDFETTLVAIESCLKSDRRWTQ